MNETKAKAICAKCGQERGKPVHQSSLAPGWHLFAALAPSALRNVTADEIVQLIGSTQTSIAADYRGDNGIAESAVRTLRMLAGIPKTARVIYDETERRYRLVTAPKAVARLARKS